MWLVAAHDINKKKRRQKKLSNLAIQQIVDNRRSYNLSAERTYLHAKPKANGGYRPIMEFTFVQKVFQKIAKWYSEIWCDHVFPGQRLKLTNVKTAIANLTEHATRHGHEFFCEIDISNFFGSIDASWLVKQFPMPKEVLKKVISTEKLTISPTSNKAAQLTNTIKNGIAQGSISSSIFATFLLASILSSSPDGENVSGYVDNIPVTGKTKNDVEQRVSALLAALSGHPGGFFKCGEPAKICRIGSRSNFIGFNIKKGDNAEVCAVASDKTVEKLLDNICYQCWNVCGPSDSEKWVTMSSLVSSFSAMYSIPEKERSRYRKFCKFLLETFRGKRDRRNAWATFKRWLNRSGFFDGNEERWTPRWLRKRLDSRAIDSLLRVISRTSLRRNSMVPLT